MLKKNDLNFSPPNNTDNVACTSSVTRSNVGSVDDIPEQTELPKDKPPKVGEDDFKLDFSTALSLLSKEDMSPKMDKVNDNPKQTKLLKSLFAPVYDESLTLLGDAPEFPRDTTFSSFSPSLWSPFMWEEWGLQEKKKLDEYLLSEINKETDSIKKEQDEHKKILEECKVLYATQTLLMKDVRNPDLTEINEQVNEKFESERTKDIEILKKIKKVVEMRFLIDILEEKDTDVEKIIYNKLGCIEVMIEKIKDIDDMIEKRIEQGKEAETIKKILL